jgi:putative selenate reductase molybdopterin-binding subunit
MAYGFGSQVVEVEVDPETGQVRVLNVWSANDCGRILNPLILDGESEGGINMGLGMGLFEEISYGDKGEIREDSFTEYRLPTVMQQPEVESIWIETIDPHGPYGAKGITEVVSMPTAPAIANAVYDAIGVRIMGLPLHPWRILEGLKEKKTKQ